MYSLNFSAENKIFCLRLHYNGDNSYLFVNGKEVTKFKAKMEMFMTLLLTIVLFQMIKYKILMLI